MILEKYSLGIGDRFSQQGEAQLKAIIRAKQHGIPIVPVWNKSNREHGIIGSSPGDTRMEADRAVNSLDWKDAYYVDADHITLHTVDRFLEHSDFFTLDVAEHIGRKLTGPELDRFLDTAETFEGLLRIPGIAESFRVDRVGLLRIAGKFLGAVREAAAVNERISRSKGAGNYVAEVSMDEVEHPQSPLELFFILLMISQFKIPVQTIAPKFSGRFNKGVDYEGDTGQFRKEFEEDLMVIDHAIHLFGLPGNLKLSVHSGSDKFTIYPVMGELIKRHGKGIHVKTAGTTWLEEVTGLAMAGGAALEMAKQIYTRSWERREELCGPYAQVIDIDPGSLPHPVKVQHWDGKKFSATLRHVPGHPDYHPGFRQLLHVGYKVAAEMEDDFLSMVREHREIVAEQVTANLYERHICRLFNI
jgi:hypothetical protein